MRLLCLFRRSAVARRAGLALILSVRVAGFGSGVCFFCVGGHLRMHVLMRLCASSLKSRDTRIRVVGYCSLGHFDMGVLYVLVWAVLTLRGSDIAVGLV